jgi:hypothetical protein
MRPLIRSLFLLSLAAAPLALAANPSPGAVASAGEVFATSSSVSAEPSAEDAALVETQVRELGTTIDDLRREVNLREEQDAARESVIGDPNVHSLWP